MTVRALCAVTLCACALGCADEPVTEIFACYSVDPALATETGNVTLCAQTDDGSRLLFGCDGSALGPLAIDPFSQGYVRRRASGVRLELGWLDAAGATVLRETAIVPFQDGRVVDVALSLDARCRAMSCGAGMTCAAGECVTERVDPGCLVDHGAPRDPRCDDPRGLGCPDPSP